MPIIKFSATGEETSLPAGSCLSLVDDMIDSCIPFSCKAGCCGSCVVKVSGEDGFVSEASDEERVFLECLGYTEHDYRLACQCIVKGDITINTNI